MKKLKLFLISLIVMLSFNFNVFGELDPMDFVPIKNAQIKKQIEESKETFADYRAVATHIYKENVATCKIVKDWFGTGTFYDYNAREVTIDTFFYNTYWTLLRGNRRSYEPLAQYFSYLLGQMGHFEEYWEYGFSSYEDYWNEFIKGVGYNEAYIAFYLWAHEIVILGTCLFLYGDYFIVERVCGSMNDFIGGLDLYIAFMNSYKKPNNLTPIMHKAKEMAMKIVASGDIIGIYMQGYEIHEPEFIEYMTEDFILYEIN